MLCDDGKGGFSADMLRELFIGRKKHKKKKKKKKKKKTENNCFQSTN